MSTIQDPSKTWLTTGSLLTVWWRMPSLGPRLPLAFQLCSLPPASQPPAGGGASPQLASSPLVFAQSFILSVGQVVPYSFLWESSVSLFFFFFSSVAIPQFGLLSHVSSLRLSSGHSGTVLTLSMQPMPPCLAAAAGGHELLGYFSAGSCG